MRFSLNKEKYSSVNLYFQDEARFGMMTHLGRYLTASGVKPIVSYQHIFKTTYLYGSYSPINGNSFVWEINGVNTIIFEAYLKEFSQYKPNEYKIVVIDNAGFHSTKNIEVPENIFLLRIPPYAPELNPCEQVWQYIKNRYKNQRFETMENLTDWLHNMVNQMTPKTIKSITGNHHYINAFNAIL
ncbi:IS630 family transposase [Lutibacter sp.]|uniref:IS630 family transposase n=1 Tax=Lutibacter sp. TaxID=1925666 RepID=UPI0025B92FB0|nr:IS630 family transposase [Lutibacter sp.]MCF6180597.1 IS630 family transposase [Lutibacter sp.]